MHSGPIRSLCLRLESGKNSPRSIVSRTLFAKSCGMLTFLSNMMFFFSSQHAFYIQNTIILEGFMIYSFKLPSSLEMSHQAIHAFKHPYFRSFLSSFFSFLWIKVIQNTDPISTTAQSCFLFNKCCFSHRSGRKISSDIPTTESMYIIFYTRIHVWGFLNLDLIYSWAKRR